MHLSFRDRLAEWRVQKIASPSFQSFAARFPFTRPFARRSGAQLYDIVAGFVYAQVLQACVELKLLTHLKKGPDTLERIAKHCDLSQERAQTLCQSAAALKLLRRVGDGHYGLGDHGAAVLGVGGLTDMIRHHRLFYRDLEDPLAVLRGTADTELSHFWPYVFGKQGEIDPDQAATYSQLMASSQLLVAEETLQAVDFNAYRRLADIGGGTGAFLQAVAARAANTELVLFDLPQVIQSAQSRLVDLGLETRIATVAGSFTTDALPTDCDAMSLIRVLYDHTDETITSLLSKIYMALPDGGSLIISEPMAGGDKPSRSGDAYFGFYTMAMTTGRARSPARIQQLLKQAGFTDTRLKRTARPFITQTIVARKRM